MGSIQNLADTPKKSVDTLKSSEERYRILVDSVKDYAIFMLDEQGHVQTWNVGAQATKGYVESEIVGRHISTFYTQADRDAGKPQRLLTQALTEGRVEDEGWRVRKDGTLFWADVIITAIRDANNKLIGFSKVTRDLTAKRATDEALRLSEERFRLMVSSVRDYAIFMLDENGHVQTWNAGAEPAKGYKSAEIIGKHISIFYPPDDAAAGKPARLLREAAEEGRVEDEGWRVKKDGSRFWADVVITAVYDAKNQLRGFTKVTRDLTARREIEEALRRSDERFKLLVQSVNDYAIFVLDPDGRITTWNHGAERIKGYTQADIIGKSFATFYVPEDLVAGKPAKALAAALSQGKFEEEGWRLRKDGSKFWAHVVIQPLKESDGRLVGFAKVTRDLTERRAADAERIRLAQAHEAIRLRDEFLSIASHELKTPLTAVMLQLQTLLQTSENLDEATQKRAARAFRSTERLSDLVEALFDVSRIATGKLTIERQRLDLSVMVNDAVERFVEQANRDGSKIAVTHQGPVLGMWDKVRIEQVIANLLGNALKYAPGNIEVATRQQGNEAILEVTDHGPGIPATERERIFGRFERAASMRHYGGLGLGLYVTREIVEAHRGSVKVEQTEPQGARFIVRLPCGETAGGTP